MGRNYKNKSKEELYKESQFWKKKYFERAAEHESVTQGIKEITASIDALLGSLSCEYGVKNEAEGNYTLKTKVPKIGKYELHTAKGENDDEMIITAKEIREEEKAGGDVPKEKAKA